MAAGCIKIAQCHYKGIWAPTELVLRLWTWPFTVGFGVLILTPRDSNKLRSFHGAQGTLNA